EAVQRVVDIGDGLVLAVGLLGQVVVGVVRVRAILVARQVEVVLAEGGREIGALDAAKGVKGERRLVTVRVGDADRQFPKKSESQKPHLSRGVTDGPPGNSTSPQRVCHPPGSS